VRGAALLAAHKVSRLGPGTLVRQRRHQNRQCVGHSVLAPHVMADDRLATVRFLKWLNGKDDARAGLMNSFLFEDCCSLPDQISFVLAFSWRGFVVTVKGRDRAH
jgi:hypothetical protein